MEFEGQLSLMAPLCLSPYNKQAPLCLSPYNKQVLVIRIRLPLSCFGSLTTFC